MAIPVNTVTRFQRRDLLAKVESFAAEFQKGFDHSLVYFSQVGAGGGSETLLTHFALAIAATRQKDRWHASDPP
jgi:hypothetical protein